MSRERNEKNETTITMIEIRITHRFQVRLIDDCSFCWPFVLFFWFFVLTPNTGVKWWILFKFYYQFITAWDETTKKKTILSKTNRKINEIKAFENRQAKQKQGKKQQKTAD